MTAGQQYPVSVTMKNTSTSTWSAAANYRLGSQNPQDNKTWGFNRVLMASGASVAPGQTCTFNFTVTAPATASTASLQWRMLQERVAWFGDATPNAAVPVSQPANAASFVSQSAATSMVTGHTYSVSLTMQNTGTTTWTAVDKYRLGSQNPQDNRTWGFNRVLMASAAPVAPGQNYTFTFNVTAPAAAGTYNFQWRMVKEGVTWFGSTSANVQVTVTAPALAATFVSQVPPPSTMNSGDIVTVSVTMKNSGTTTWTPGSGFKLGSQNPQDNNAWGEGRALLPSSVPPGAQVTISFPAHAPGSAGTYHFQWRMLEENVVWFGDISPDSPVTVSVPPPLPPGRLEILNLAGTTLQGNPLNDPVARRVALFVPQQVQPGQAVPIVYFMPGYGGSSEDYIAAGPSCSFSTLVQSMANSGHPVVIAIPDCRNRFGGSQYLNSTAQGNYADYVINDIIPAVEARYPAAAGRLGRMIAGHSSGGFGALRFGMANQSLFGAVISLSADAEFNVTQLPFAQSPDVSSVSPQTASDCSGPNPIATPPTSDAAEAFGLSAAYAPASPPQPGYFQWLYDSTGAFRNDVWQLWTNNDPYVLVQANPSAFAADQRIYLDGAANDEWSANISAGDLYSVLNSRGQPCTFNQPPGYHSDNISGRLSNGLHWALQMAP